MNLKPETINAIIELSASLGRAYFDHYKAKTWDQDLSKVITPFAVEMLERMVLAIREDVIEQVACWKEEHDYIRSLEAQVKAILEQND